MRYANYAYGLYLEHSYRYYEMDCPIIRDWEFDALCRVLLVRWPLVTHRFKSLTDEASLAAGTGYQLYGKIHPKIVQLIHRAGALPLCQRFNRLPPLDAYQQRAYRLICDLNFAGIDGPCRFEDVCYTASVIRKIAPCPTDLAIPLI